MNNNYTLRIIPSNPQDRVDVFKRICELLNLDADKQVEKLGVTSTSQGLNMNIEMLFKFLYLNKLKGEFNFKDKTLAIVCEEKPSKGKAAIENPETIGESVVDGPVSDEGPGAPDGSESLTPLEEDLKDDDPENDDPF